MEEPWQFASWNVAGLCHPHRKYKIVNWVKTRRPPLAALALQELETDDFRLDVALRTILPQYQYFSSPPYEGRGGSALLLHPLHTVISSGILDEGRATWVIISHSEGPVGLVSIYAPNSSRLWAVLWEELKNTLPSAQWILSGDYNMRESMETYLRTGLSAIQNRPLLYQRRWMVTGLHWNTSAQWCSSNFRSRPHCPFTPHITTSSKRFTP
jgi:exonuclease III